MNRQTTYTISPSHRSRKVISVPAGQTEFFVRVSRHLIDFIEFSNNPESLPQAYSFSGWLPNSYLAIFRLFTDLITNSNRLQTQTVTFGDDQCVSLPDLFEHQNNIRMIWNNYIPFQTAL